MHSPLIQVHAQSATATLSGTVTDEAGAVVPGVSIAVINLAKGFQRSTSTDDEGSFVVSLLPPGNYTVKAEREGFNPAEVRDVVLNVNDQKVIRVYLKVGSISQNVEIVHGSGLLDQSPAVSTVIDRQFVGNLPLNGRSFQSLIALTPGFVLTRTNSENQGQFSVNGQRTNANYFMIDGVGANIGISPGTNIAAATAGTTPGLSAMGGTNNLVSVDALQEFKVLTSTFAPEFGRTPGAQVQILTRSGTSEFHGTAFEYVRNDVFDAADWFRNATRQPRAPLRQHDFGGVLGGPFYLPDFDENGLLFRKMKHTFFFFSYEGLRLRLPQTTANAPVPTVNARTIAPPGVRDLFAAYPLPNGRELGNNLAEFSATYSDPSSLDATSIRIDHIANDRLSFFVRYNNSPSEAATRTGGLAGISHSAYKLQTLTAGTTLIFSSNATNDLRANYSRNEGRSFFSLSTFGGATPPPNSLLFSNFGVPETGNSVVLIGGLTALQQGSFGYDVQRQTNVLNTLSLIRRNHQLKFGVDYRRLTPIFDRANYSQQVSLSSVNTAIATARASASITAYFGPVFPVFDNVSVFGQDTWMVNSRLTLTYGSRWEFNPPPTEATGNNPLPLTGLDSLATIALAPEGTPLYKKRYNNFAPRLGFAYELIQAAGRETMLRGGLGIFYDLGTGPVASAFSTGFPYFRRGPTLVNVPYPLSMANAAPPPQFSKPPVGNVGNALGVLDPNFRLPVSYQWNLSLEQSMGAAQTITASYVAAVGRRLIRQELLVNPNPTFSQVRISRNSANSDYHALQLQFQRRLARGLQALASYSWSQSLDNVSLDSSSEAPSFNIDVGNERGPSDFDVRHSLTGGVTYEIPAIAKRGLVSQLIRNFSLDGTFIARTAMPLNVVTGTNIIGGSNMSRPDLVTTVPLYVDDPSAPGGWRINRAAFTVPSGRQGTLGRNALRGFPLWQLDLALRREFSLTEVLKVQLRTEVFNIFNHPNFGEPVRQLSSPQFGIANLMLGRSLGTGGAGGGFNPLYQVGGPRSMQLAVKFLF